MGDPEPEGRREGEEAAGPDAPERQHTGRFVPRCPARTLERGAVPSTCEVQQDGDSGAERGDPKAAVTERLHVPSEPPQAEGLERWVRLSGDSCPPGEDAGKDGWGCTTGPEGGPVSRSWGGTVCAGYKADLWDR